MCPALVTDAKLPADEQRLAVATKRAIQAAGGLKVCAFETDLSDSQLSRASSATERDSLSIRNAVRVDQIGRGEQGHPHILSAMATIVGAVVIMLPEAIDGSSSLQMGVVEIASEFGDVSRAIAESLSGTSAGGAAMTPREAEATLQQIADVERATAKLRHTLERIAAGTEQPP
jgi:hypothetical protein